MSKEVREEKKKNDVVIEDWAVAVLKNLSIAVDTVMWRPELFPRLKGDLEKSAPDVIQAFLILVKDEYRGEVWELIKKVMKMVQKLQGLSS